MRNLLLMMVCTVLPLTSVSQNSVANHIDNFLGRTVDYGFSGAVAVSKNGKMILNKGYGLANRTTGKPISKNSIFSIGSVTKQFTGAAIMKLEMMKKLHTEDKITKYFNDVPVDKQNITIHNLLTHTSGMPGAIGDDFNHISKESYIKQALETPLEFSPGEGFNYSNTGYSLLAMIVEKQSGVSYEHFLKKNLFEPAGMKQTGYKLPHFDKENFVHIYNGITDNGSSIRFTNPTWHLIGNGGILSTTTDMIAWVYALKGEKILSKMAKKKMFTAYVNEYGYGWDVIDDDSLRQHDGGSGLGLSAELRWYVKDDAITMLFTSATINGELGFEVLREDLEALLMGEKVTLPPSISKVQVEPDNFAGKYKLPSGQLFEIIKENLNLVLRVDNQESYDLISNPKEFGNDHMNSLLNSKFDKAFKLAFSNGDYSGFSFTGAKKQLEKAIKDEIEMEGYDNPNYKVIRTLSSSDSKAVKITQVAISDDPKFEHESLILSLKTKDYKFHAMDVDFGYAGPLNLILYPMGENKFQAYSLSKKLGAIVEIVNSNGNCTFFIDNVLVPGIKKLP